MTISERISGLLSQVESMSANNAEELEALRLKYMSKKGAIPQLFEQFKAVPKIPGNLCKVSGDFFISTHVPPP